MNEKQRRVYAKKIVDECERAVRLFGYTRPEATRAYTAQFVRYERGTYTVAVDGYELDYHITPRGPRFYAEFPIQPAD